MAVNSPTSKVANIFSKIFNPLCYLTKREIERMIQNWHHGDDVKLQLIFSQIEQQSSIYQVCISKRISGVLNREWDVTTVDDSPEAKKQQEAVRAMLRKSDTLNQDGLTDAIRHLVMSSFRGRAVIKPFFSEKGDLFFKRLNNWNVLEFNGNLYWNPTSEQVGWLDTETVDKVVPLPQSEVCWLKSDMPIDVPGLMIYLRQLVGEDQWARFVEKQGIPQVIINTPDGTPDSALDMWNQRALQIFEGGSGTLPFNANVHVLDSARGQDPFTSYIQHQMEMISILATGGTLMTIGGSSGLGSDLARVQQESFNSIVNNDCKRISNAMTNSVVSKCVKKLFGDAEPLVRFTFIEDEEYSANDYLDMAVKLNSLGVKVDATKLKEITKLDFIDDSESSWTPSEQPKEWTPEEKASLKEEIERG